MAEHGESAAVPVEPYTALARVYDLVMEHVDYFEWAEYVFSLMMAYGREASAVLELGCGTGSLALELNRLWPFEYLATDVSADMIRAAEAKSPGTSIRFGVADVRDFSLGEQFDVALLLYDGINYLLEASEVERALACVRRHVRPGGLFIFDQSTPANSLNNRDFFEDTEDFGDVAFVRRSEYDEQNGLHHTSFDVVVDGASFTEHHVQRAYTFDQMRTLVSRSEWSLEAALDGFTEEPATEASERVHWILRTA